MLEVVRPGPLGELVSHRSRVHHGQVRCSGAERLGDDVRPIVSDVFNAAAGRLEESQ